MLIVREPKSNPDGTVSVKVISTVTPSSLRAPEADGKKDAARRDEARIGTRR